MAMGGTVDGLMVTRNGRRFVEEQVASLQLQTFRSWRLLVSDDCSDDGTLDVVRGLARAHHRGRMPT